MNKTIQKNGNFTNYKLFNQTKKYGYNDYRILNVVCSTDTSRNEIFKVFCKFGKIEEMNMNKVSNKNISNDF